MFVTGGVGSFPHMGVGQDGMGNRNQIMNTSSSGVNRPGVPSDYNSLVQTSRASLAIPIPTWVMDELFIEGFFSPSTATYYRNNNVVVVVVVVVISCVRDLYRLLGFLLLLIRIVALHFESYVWMLCYTVVCVHVRLRRYSHTIGVRENFSCPHLSSGAFLVFIGLVMSSIVILICQSGYFCYSIYSITTIPTKPWHNEVQPDLRQQLVRKL